MKNNGWKNKWISLVLAGVLTFPLTGCGEKKELPPDDVCNHGALAIMETDAGYYTNYGYKYIHGQESTGPNVYEMPQFLCYYDKEQHTMIRLCDKPECEHKGDDSCVASYKNIDVQNSILYNGMIYIYATEKNGSTIEFNLYQVSLDGSSIDKVGTAFTVENSGDKIFNKTTTFNRNSDYFIIHKGYAYLPYYARIGQTTMGFKGGGVLQMDLETGAVKTVYEMKTANSGMAYNLFAIDNYVYMQLEGSSPKCMRYNINEEQLEEIWKETEDGPSLLHSYWIDIANENYQFEVEEIHETPEGEEVYTQIFVFDAETGEDLLDKKFTTDVTRWEFKQLSKLMIYQDMLLYITDERILFYSIREETWGEKLAEIPFEMNFFEGFNGNANFSIVNNKLYYVRVPVLEEYQETLNTADAGTNGEAETIKNEEITNEDGTKEKSVEEDYEQGPKPGETWIYMADISQPYSQFTEYRVYSWPIDDILSGVGQWKFEFSYDSCGGILFSGSALNEEPIIIKNE